MNRKSLFSLAAWLLGIELVAAQGTAFTYQGRLNDDANPSGNGRYDFQFRVYDADTGIGSVGGSLATYFVPVSNGLFTVVLDFGAGIFPGPNRWLDIAVRTNLGGSFVPLSPRQQLTPTPYAIFAESVNAAGISGTIANSKLPPNVARVDSNTVFTGTVSFSNTADSFSGNFFGNGAGVTNVDLPLNSCGAIRLAGEFRLSSSPSVGDYPYAVIAVDVNGDGKLDLVSANYEGATLSVLTNDGRGGFMLASSPAVGLFVSSVATADVNGDGKPDLISANTPDHTLSVLTNDGSGGFVLASTPSTVGAPYKVVAADVNGDGKPDLITANFADNTLTVLTNNGSGGFVLASMPGGVNFPFSVTAADVNGDGKIDLIATSYSSSTLSVLTNNGTGGFVLASSPGVGSPQIAVTMADVNGDGWVDLISANWTANTLTVLTNNGSGGFVLASSPAVGSYPASVAAADLNGDGKVDLISANSHDNTLSVLTNDGRGGFVLASLPNVGLEPYSVIAAEVSGDCNMDLICANRLGNTLSVLFNTVTFTGSFSGDGGGLTSLNASQLTSGTVADARLSANVALRSGGNTFSGSQTINGGIRLDSTDGFSQSSAGNFNIDAPSVVGGRLAVLANGNVGIGAPSPQQRLSVAAGMNIDQNNANNGTVANTVSFGSNSGEAIGSRRTAGVNQFGLDFYTSSINRLSIYNNGNVAIAAPGLLSFGAQTRQMLNLWNANYGIGVQAYTEYFRSDSDFSWFKGGSHNENQNNPGGGTEMMRLDALGNLRTLNGTIAPLSDRNAKEHFEPVNGREVLEQVAELPVSRWSFKSDPNSRHLGPMAQDFWATFHVGLDDKSICTVDADGVALAAIQGLNEKVKEKDAKISELEKRLGDLEQIVQSLAAKK